MAPQKEIDILNIIKDNISIGDNVVRNDGMNGYVLHKQGGQFAGDIVLIIQYDDDSEGSCLLHSLQDLRYFSSIKGRSIEQLAGRFLEQ